MGEQNGLEQYLRPSAKKPPKSREASRAIMLDVHLPDDEQIAYSYSLLTKVRMSRKQVIAEFVPGKVIVEGVCLEPLYRALIQHRVRSVKITDDGRSFASSIRSTEPVITGIRVVESGDQE